MYKTFIEIYNQSYSIIQISLFILSIMIVFIIEYITYYNNIAYGIISPIPGISNTAPTTNVSSSNIKIKHKKIKYKK